MGLGDSMLNDENPIVTSLRYAVTGAALGAGLGALGNKIEKAEKVNKDMVKSNKEKSNNGKQRENNSGTNSGNGTKDERVRNIRRLYTTNNGNVQPYKIRSNDGSSRRMVVNIHEPSKILKSEYQKQGWRTDSYYELEVNSDSSASFFKDIMKKNLNVRGKSSAQVYEYSAAEYKEMKLFVSEYGTSGFAIKKDGDIVSVFSTAKGSSKAMLELAIQNGGRKLDCFDTYLPDIYKKHGFKEVFREKWNEKYKPEGWDKKHFIIFNNGEPDVIYMELEL